MNEDEKLRAVLLSFGIALLFLAILYWLNS